MIVDLQSYDSDAALEADVCIVGSGAAGLALARELMATRRRVLVLESGGESDEPETQALYDTEDTGLPFPTARGGRFRVFGGSTTRWGGQALPLERSDFERREWVAHSGWPIAYDEVARYYARASDFLRVDPFGYDDALLARIGARPPALDRRLLRYHLSKWSPVPNTREMYRDALARSANLTLLLHANVTRLGLDESGEVIETVEARTLGGRRLTVKAARVVIACGGIESARLLLANRGQRPEGLGNASGALGRFLQDHPASVAGYLQPRDERAAQRIFNQFHRAGLKYSVRCSATEALQRGERILNATAAVFFQVGEESPHETLRATAHMLRRRELGPSLVAQAARCVRVAPYLARPLWEYFVRGRTYTPQARFRVILNTEQEPDPTSRIALSERTDALGLPMARVHWQLTPLSAHTCRVFAHELKRQLANAGVGELLLEPWLEDERSDWTSRLADQNHHIGTTRMGVSARDGVVDPDLRVHGTRNLYVASSSVFPTGGHSNPTLTLIALAIRLADHLGRA